MQKILNPKYHLPGVVELSKPVSKIEIAIFSGWDCISVILYRETQCGLLLTRGLKYAPLRNNPRKRHKSKNLRLK